MTSTLDPVTLTLDPVTLTLDPVTLSLDIALTLWVLQVKSDMMYLFLCQLLCHCLKYEQCREKTCLQGFQPGPMKKETISNAY